ncbi:hypothetical protein PUN28_005640 [Cardiocondyla obscurior]
MNSKRNSRSKGNMLEPRVPPRPVDAGNTSGLDPEAEDRFELELCWCIQQLETNIGKLQEKQALKLSKQLDSLKSNTAPLVKKRQIMRNTLGDYREKMAEDEQRLSKTASAVKFIGSASANKKSLFIKKATGCNAQNFGKQVDNRLQNAEKTAGDSSDTPFQFNFQACQ